MKTLLWLWRVEQQWRPYLDLISIKFKVQNDVQNEDPNQNRIC
jgi:hypothetical protein